MSTSTTKWDWMYDRSKRFLESWIDDALEEIESIDDEKIDVFFFQIVQKTSAGTDHLQKTAAGVMVLLIDLEVLVEVIDAFGQKRNLNLGRTRIALVQRVLCNNFLFRHVFFLLLFVSP